MDKNILREFYRDFEEKHMGIEFSKQGLKGFYEILDIEWGHSEMEEKFAEVQHKILVHGLKAALKRIQILFPDPMGRDSPQRTILVLKEDWKKWIFQIESKYSDLSELEKDKLREIVRTYIMKGKQR